MTGLVPFFVVKQGEALCVSLFREGQDERTGEKEKRVSFIPTLCEDCIHPGADPEEVDLEVRETQEN